MDLGHPKRLNHSVIFLITAPVKLFHQRVTTESVDYDEVMLSHVFEQIRSHVLQGCSLAF